MNTDGLQWDPVYEGLADGQTVLVGGTPLPVRLDVVNYSPRGFAWGAAHGPGQAQLAFAMLAHHTGNDALALALHQLLKVKLIMRLPQDRTWSLPSCYLAGWVDGHRLRGE